MARRRDLPSGTVTFMFTDIEGSTRLLHEMGPDAYAAALAEHRALIRRAVAQHGGVEVDTQGDAFFVAFADASGAVAAALEAQRLLGGGPVRVRMSLHTGEPRQTAEGYVGHDIHLGARIAATAHGGQVVLSGATRQLVEAQVTDLGEHRLKDIAEPIWLYQLGTSAFPPLSSISNTNLPRPASNLIGRDREVREITEQLRDGVRLLTLTGPGGSGKTRLSLEAASELVPHFRNGTFWVELAPISQSELVLPTIAGVIGAQDELERHIGERSMLLVLDNLEQVVGAAPELGRLVEHCPNLRVLATSRELLRVGGEREYAVPALGSDEAVRLFCERAGLEADGPIAELCARLDNLPLAIELAAARTSVMSPAQILDRLARRLDLLKGERDAAARQQTLRATIEWSHDLLDERGRQLFAELAVFSGGWTLEAAEEIARADLDVLGSLVDKSLVRHEAERFGMLETIRAFALERLDAALDAPEVRQRHAAFYLALAREAAPHLRNESDDWSERLESELDNLRAAFDFLAESGDDGGVIELMAAAWRIWSMPGGLQEGRRLVDAALARAKARDSARAELLIAAADMANDSDDLVPGRALAEEGLLLHEELGDTWGEAHAHLILGLALAATEDWPPAREHFERSVTLFESVNDDYWALQAIRRVAWVHESMGDRDRARLIWQASYERARAINDPYGEARALTVLAQYDIDQGRVTGEGVARLTAAHGLHRARRGMNDQYWDAVLLCRFAQALSLRGNMELAAALLARFATRLEELGGPHEPWLARMNYATQAQIRGLLGPDSIALAQERGRTLSIDDAVEMAATWLEKSP